MELRDYAKVLRKRWRLIVVCTLVAIIGAILVTVRAEPQYRTTVGFFVSTSDRGSGDTSNSAYTGSLFAQQRVKSYASVASGPLIAGRVARDLGGLPREDVEGHLRASVVPDTVLLMVTASASTRERALKLAQSVGRLFPQLVSALESRDPSKPSTASASVIQEPRLPAAPYTPQPLRNLTFAALIGLLIGLAVAAVKEALDNTVNSASDVLAITGSPTLGAIGFDPATSKRPLIVQSGSESARAEAFRQLRTNLQFVEVDSRLSSLTLTSSVPNEGKSTSACNLALTLAQSGVRTVLVEGDLRRPRVADYLGLEDAVGLTSVLIGKVSLDDALQSFGDGTLQVLPSGPLPPNPSELLSSAGMQELVAWLEHDYDMVIIDAPPLLPVTDAAILATLTSGAVLVVKCRSTRRDQLGRAAGALYAVDARVLGCVLNMVPRRGPDAYVTNGYGGGYRRSKAYGSSRQKVRMSEDEAALALEASRQETLLTDG